MTNLAAEHPGLVPGEILIAAYLTYHAVREAVEPLGVGFQKVESPEVARILGVHLLIVPVLPSAEDLVQETSDQSAWSTATTSKNRGDFWRKIQFLQ